MTWLRSCMVLACLVVARPAWADDDDDKKPGKGKGKPEAKPVAVQIDLSKLPPDLAKQLMKYIGGKTEKSPSKRVAAPPPKGPPAAKGKGKAPQLQLPPGLAKKSADHPGRLNYIKNHGDGKKAPAATTRIKKDKDDDDD